MPTQFPAKIACIDQTVVSALWPHARGLIRRAVEKTDLSDFAVVESEILAGKQLLWLAWREAIIEAAASTKIIGIGPHKICVLVACAGQGDWPALMVEIEGYAQAEGCKAMRIYGRKGWERVLEGYASKYAIMEKELTAAQ